jgi:hypothetical protein
LIISKPYIAIGIVGLLRSESLGTWIRSSKLGGTYLMDLVCSFHTCGFGLPWSYSKSKFKTGTLFVDGG